LNIQFGGEAQWRQYVTNITPRPAAQLLGISLNSATWSASSNSSTITELLGKMAPRVSEATKADRDNIYVRSAFNYVDAINKAIPELNQTSLERVR